MRRFSVDVVRKVVYNCTCIVQCNEGFLQMKIGEAFIEMLKGTETKASLDVWSLICRSSKGPSGLRQKTRRKEPLLIQL